MDHRLTDGQGRLLRTPRENPGSKIKKHKFLAKTNDLIVFLTLKYIQTIKNMSISIVSGKYFFFFYCFPKRVTSNAAKSRIDVAKLMSDSDSEAKST